MKIYNFTKTKELLEFHKYTVVGYTESSYSNVKVSKDNEYLHLSVSDHGCQIGQDSYRHLKRPETILSKISTILTSEKSKKLRDQKAGNIHTNLKNALILQGVEFSSYKNSVHKTISKYSRTTIGANSELWLKDVLGDSFSSSDKLTINVTNESRITYKLNLEDFDLVNKVKIFVNEFKDNYLVQQL